MGFPDDLPKTRTRQMVEGLAVEVAGLKTKLDTPARKTLDGLVETTRQLSSAVEELQRLVADLSSGQRALVLQRPRALSSAEVAEHQPTTRFIVIAPDRTLGLQAGDVIDPRSRFSTFDEFRRRVDAGLQVAVAEN